MKPIILPLPDPQANIETVGGKGASLAKLARAGLPVPDGFYITTVAYRQFVTAGNLQARILSALERVDAAQPSTLEAASTTIAQLFAETEISTQLADEILQAYHSLAGHTPAVAVRSSATAEDLPDASFAGQQETYLNIHGEDALLDSVRKCWASLWTARAISYRLHQGIPSDSAALSVIVQELVPADAAGILFTANPISGKRNELVINAAWGLGEAVVSGAVTPDTVIIDKSTGHVLHSNIAEKQVMTVGVETGTEEQPVPDPLKNKAVLTDAQATSLSHFGTQIEQIYGMPMDIEWALAQGQFAILQARPITTIPEKMHKEIEWTLPNPKGQYMRGSIVDMMPDPVSPLFATLGIPSITRIGIKQVLKPLTRSEPDLPGDYITTINEYAYMCASFTPRQWWWVIAHMMLSFPRILREARPLWRDKIRPQYAAMVARWMAKPLKTMSAAEIWAGIQEVNDAAMLHMAALLVATTGASAGSEMLFTRVYEKMIRRADDPAASTYLMGYDSTPIQAEKSLYDLAEWIRACPPIAAHVSATSTDDLVAELASPESPLEGEQGMQYWSELRQRFQTHLSSYGHIIYDVDFTKPLPLDKPAPMLETIKMYLQGSGANPHERQRNAEQKRLQSTASILNRHKGLRRWAFRKTLDMAQVMAQVRENALADIGLGYPLLRRMLHALGGYFTKAGVIKQPQDIFWLEMEQVNNTITAMEHGEALNDFSISVAERQATHEALKHVIPPPTLPPKKKYMGFDMAAFTPAAAESQTGDTLKGIPASPGHVTAAACVLRDPQDFDQMRPGDILVASTTTPAWTPLFAMASAIVTDIGGPLSHGSIVAREYGIPAVMGTGVATRRIKSGQMITVDGASGTVIILG
ncbi:MAG TPA: PEP/pyruvate-binding domain-containing protein [Anaerolineales bacterium]|nr:PEP/pyruvate-binding domain-containing protein [Anaerolineales bacterium]